MKKRLLVFITFIALVLSAAGCGNTHPDKAEAFTENNLQAPSPTVADSAATAGRQDGERFEDVIMLEGMEETVRYEHIRNDALGFEIDYDYESLVRRAGSDRELFISIYDAADNPQNYLEVTYCAEDADTVSASISEQLSNDYDISRGPFILDRAGSCIRIDASCAKGGSGTPDLLQAVYVIPAADGSRIAAAHYSYESAEGFGRRFRYIVNTLTVIDRNVERKLSDDQALSAIKSYCFISNPDLESIVNSGDYPVYWTVSSSDENTIVVLFRSYTGAQIRYYIDRITGYTYATESVPAAAPEEVRTEESLNAWEYLS